MNVLVFGGTGFVGLNIADALLARGHAVTLFDRAGLPAAAQRAYAVHGDRLTLVQGDVLDRDAVEAAIAVLRTDRTALLIAHRLEQAATADRIAVFADGRIVQHGTHADLLASPGPYRESWLAHSPHPNQHTEPTREAETP